MVRSARVEIAGGVLQVREDEPAPRIDTGLHRTPRGKRDLPNATLGAEPVFLVNDTSE